MSGYEKINGQYVQTGAINVLEHGAKGDGITDDTAAIQAVINSANGLPIYLPQGNFLVSTGLVVTNNLYMYGPGVLLQKYNVPALAFQPAWGAAFAVTAQTQLLYPLAADGKDDYITRLTVDAAAIATGAYVRDAVFKIWSNDTYPYVAAMTASQKNWLSETVKILDVDTTNNYIYCDRALEDTYTTTPMIRSAPTQNLFLDVYGNTYNPTGYPTLPVLAVSLTKSGTTATLTVPANTLDFPTGTSIGIEGASEDGTTTASTNYNGIFTVTRVSATVYTYTMPGTPANNATPQWGGIYAAIDDRQDMFIFEGSVYGEVKLHTYQSWRAVAAFRSGYGNKYDLISENQIDIPGAGGFGYGVYPDGSEYGLSGNIRASRIRHAFTTNIQKATTFSNANYVKHGVPLRCGVLNGIAIGGIGADWDTHEGARFTFFDNIESESPRRGQTGSIQGSAFQNRGEGTKVGRISCRGSSRGIKELSQSYPFGRQSITKFDTVILEDIDELGFEVDTNTTYTGTANQARLEITSLTMRNIGGHPGTSSDGVTPSNPYGLYVDQQAIVDIKTLLADSMQTRVIHQTDSPSGTTYITIDDLRITRQGASSSDPWLQMNRGPNLSINNAEFDYTGSTSTRDPLRFSTGGGSGTVTVKEAHVIATGGTPTNFINVTASSGGAYTLTANLGHITSTNTAMILTAQTASNSNVITVNDISCFPRRGITSDQGDASVSFNTLGTPSHPVVYYNTALTAAREVTLNRTLDATDGSETVLGFNEQTYRSVNSTGAFDLGTGDGNDATLTNNSLSTNSGVTTITTASNHGYAANDLVKVSGASSAFNGIHRIINVPSATTYRIRVASPSGTTPGTSTRVLTRLQLPEMYANHLWDGVAWRPQGIVLPYQTVFSSTNWIDTNVTLTYKNGTMLADATGGNITITIPTAAGYGDVVFRFKKLDSSGNTVTASCAAGIDGGTTKVLSTQYASSTLISDNVQWWTF